LARDVELIGKQTAKKDLKRGTRNGRGDSVRKSPEGRGGPNQKNRKGQKELFLEKGHKKKRFMRSVQRVTRSRIGKSRSLFPQKKKTKKGKD